MQVKGGAMNREEFQNSLTELGELAGKNGNRLTGDQVREFFSAMELSEEQYELIFAYLASRQIVVAGYVPAKEEEEKKQQEKQQQEKQPLSEEERHFLKNYQAELACLELLEEQELLALCRQVEETGDELTKAKLTEQMLPEVLRLAHDFRGQELSLGDLVQDDHTEKEAGSLLVDRLNHLRDEIRKLTDELERKVSVDELAMYMDMPVEEIENLLKLAGETPKDDGEREE